MRGKMRNIKWKKYIASFLTFCLLVGQCSISAQAEGTELQENNTEIVTEQQLEEGSDLLDYVEESNQVTSDIDLSDTIPANIEESEEQPYVDLSNINLTEYDYIVEAANSDNSEGASNYLAYVYDPSAPNYLGMPLNSKSFLDYDIKYMKGDSLDVVFADENGNLIDVEEFVPVFVNTDVFEISKIEEEPSRLHVEVIGDYIYGGAYASRLIINGYEGMIFIPLQGRWFFDRSIYCLNNNGEYEKLDDYNFYVPLFKKQVIKFKYDERDEEFIKDLKGTVSLEQLSGGILEDGSGIYFRPINTDLLTNEQNKRLFVLIEDDCVAYLDLTYGKYNLPENAVYYDGAYATADVVNDGLDEKVIIDEFSIKSGEEKTFRLDFYDANGNYLSPEELIPCEYPFSINYNMDVEEDPYYEIYVGGDAATGCYNIPFCVIENDGTVKYIDVPINVVDDTEPENPGGEEIGNDNYNAFSTGKNFFIECTEDAVITVENLSQKIDEQDINCEIVKKLFVYSSTENSVLGDGEESILSLFPNVEYAELHISHIADYAFSGSNHLAELYVGCGDIGKGVFADNSSLEYVYLSPDLSSVGEGIFKNCPKLKTAGTVGYGFRNIDFNELYDEEEGYYYIPANLFSSSDIETVYLFNINHIEENAFADTNIKEIYFDQLICRQLEKNNIENAFTNASIGKILFRESKDVWEEAVKIEGDFNYESFEDNYRFIIASGNAGTKTDDDYADNVRWTLYSDKQLIFSGEGAIGEGWIDSGYNQSPWNHIVVERVVIDKGITSIGKNAFRNMNQIKNVVIADSVTTIEENAFAGCEGYYRINLPISLKNIGHNAFSGKTNLWQGEGAHFYYSGTEEEWLAIKDDTFPKNAEVKTSYQPTAIQGTGSDSESDSKIIFYGEDGEYKDLLDLKVGDVITFEVDAAPGRALKYLKVGSYIVYYKGLYGNSFVVGENTNIKFEFEEVETDSIEINGNCGSETTWKLTDDTLTISGTGATDDFTEDSTPFEEYRETIKNIVVEEGVTAIGKYLFSGCTNVEAIDLPSTLVSIGDYNFTGIKLSGYVVIPASVEYIGKAAFGECPEILGFEIEEGNTNYKYENGYLLTMDGKTLVKATKEALTYGMNDAAVLPEGVETIGEKAFVDVSGIRGAELPVSLKNIEDYAFAGLSNLRQILIHPTLKTLGTDVFKGTVYEKPKVSVDPITGQEIIREGSVYYTGTQDQFDIIKNKISTRNINVYCGFRILEDVSVTTRDFEKVGNSLKLSRISDDVEGYLLARVDNGYNPITFEEIDRSFTVSSSDESVAEIYFDGVGLEEGIEFSEKAFIRYILKGEGKTQITLISNADESKKFTFTLEVVQKATDVSFKWAGNYTKNDELLIIPDAKKDVVYKATTTWSSGKAWESDEYHFAAMKEGNEIELPEFIVLNEKTGELKISKGADTSVLSEDQRTFEIVLLADTNPNDENPCELSYTMSVVLFDQKASDVTFVTPDEGNELSIVSDKLVLDPIAGKTECDIYAVPYSVDEFMSGMDVNSRYSEVVLSSTSNPNFEVTENTDGSLHVKMLGNTGSITITAKTLDGSNKSKNVVVSAGTLVKGIDITSTLKEVDKDTYILTKGKSAALTVDILPLNPTQKKIMWVVDPQQSEYLTVSSGKITAKEVSADPIEVAAYATDGSGVSKSINVYVIESVTGVEIYGAENGETLKAIELEKGYEPAEYTLDASAFRTYKGENGETLKDFESVYGEVEWSIKGSIAKDVSFSTDGNMLNFMVDKPGTFTVRATAMDGSGKYAEVKVTVKQLPLFVEMTASGVSSVYTDDYDVWLFRGDLKKGITVKPTVKMKAYHTVDSKYMGYKLYLGEGWSDGYNAGQEHQLVVDAKGNPAKQFKLTSVDQTSGKYTLTVVPDKNPDARWTVYIQVEPKSGLVLEDLEIRFPSTVNTYYNYDLAEERFAVRVAAGTKIEMSEFLNGAKITKVMKDVVKTWSIDEFVTVSGAKSYLTVPQGTEAGLYELTLTYTDARDAENTVSKTVLVDVKEKVAKENIDLILENEAVVGGIIYEAGTSIKEIAAVLTPDAGTLRFAPTAVSTDNSQINPENASYIFEVSSSNAKVLAVEEEYEWGIPQPYYSVKAIAPGKATIKAKIIDGSNVEQSFNVTVSKVSTPITAIASSSTTYTVGLYNPMVIGYSLKSTNDVPTMTAMEWTVSDSSLFMIEDLGVDTENPVVEKIDAKKGTVYYKSEGQIRLSPMGKVGKVTVTGKALDGSNKTIKFTVNIAKNTTAYAVNINVPATAATGGKVGTVVLPWGKTLKLSASLMPNKAKNAIVTYSI